MKEQNIRRLNALATLVGMLAVALSLVMMSIAVFSPPPSTIPTASPTRTLTPSRTPTPTLTPSPTVTPVPLVVLVSVEYLPSSTQCQVDVTVQVNGEELTGIFHVWNTSSEDSIGHLSEPIRLPPGQSSGYLLTLNDKTPLSSTYEIWFTYPNGQSNRLKNLVCPQETPGAE
ncbi:MAG: hypothetical protein DDG60_00100 [Anaerolineae bacterium]|nr:MAG: hypothetical protein DDG60_00100 [Anaerolineae bacterium]